MYKLLLSPTLSQFKVCDLWILGSKEWDVNLLQELFVTTDVAEISSIPLNPIDLAS